MKHEKLISELTPKVMTRRRFLEQAAVMALSVSVLSGCSKSRSGTVIVTVFDISSSTHTDVVAQRYLDGFKQIVAAAQGGDTLSGYPITAVTQSTSMDRFTDTFPVSKGLLDNTDVYAAKFAQIQRDAVSKAASVLKLPTARATDILNAFSDAAGIYDGYPGVKRSLVIFSDMLHQTAQYDFAREDLTPSRTQAILQAQRQAGLLPSLAGVTVWVAGASADPFDPATPHSGPMGFGGLDPKKIAQIRDFWIAFFSACGAHLTTDRYSTTLQNYRG